jgi:hypothetical protein
VAAAESSMAIGMVRETSSGCRRCRTRYETPSSEGVIASSVIRRRRLSRSTGVTLRGPGQGPKVSTRALPVRGRANGRAGGALPGS